MKFLSLLNFLIPSSCHVFFVPHRISNHFGNEITNNKKVKIVPNKEILSSSKSNKSIGDAKTQPHT